MTNETERTVTISADYFAELYVKAKVNGKMLDELRRERDTLSRERDELKAKLDGDATAKLDGDATANGLSPVTQKLLETERRLADAERCIEGIRHKVDCHFENYDGPYSGETLEAIKRTIRAWREKREAK